MKIRLFHRQPMPGSTRAILKEGTDEPYACQLEVDRLFDAVVRGWPQLLADAIIRLSDSRSEEDFERRYEELVMASGA